MPSTTILHTQSQNLNVLTCKTFFFVVVFYLLLYIQSTVFQLCQDWSSWVEPVLSSDNCVLLKNTTQCRQQGLNLLHLSLESSTLPLSHCTLNTKNVISKLFLFWNIHAPAFFNLLNLLQKEIFIYFPLTHLIDSIIHEHVCKILYIAVDCYCIQGSHRNSKTKFHDFSMINNVISMII